MASALKITSDDTEVGILPEQGGCVATYATHTPAGTRTWFTGGPDNIACFPMVPFCSRIENGEFRYADIAVSLPPNNAPEPHAIHGHGFQRIWDVISHESNAVCLEYHYAADTWPWSYTARLAYRLEGACLCVALILSNHSATAMPYGLGLHPYLPVTGEVHIAAEVAGVWELDRSLIGRGRSQALADTGAVSELLPARQSLDVAYAGWSGQARISWPEWDAHLTIAADVADTLVIYSPQGAKYVCVEPLSNAPNGFNLTGSTDGCYRTLAAGVTVTETWHFKPETGCFG